MEFSETFLVDLQEAFEYWKLQRLADQKNPVSPAVLNAMPLETWVAGLLQQPIDGLLGQKRTNNAAKKTQHSAQGE